MTKTDAATVTEAPEHTPGNTSSLLAMGLLGSARHAMVNVFHGISEMFRLVRAYNDLTRLDHVTLREIGGRRGELDRILGGHPPRNYR
jgi:hypothetical protein